MRTPESKGYARVNGVELYYEIHGDGPPLIMLHGGVTPSEMFGAPLAEMARAHKVIALHARGHGLSRDSSRPWSFELFADDVVHRDPYGDDDLLDFVARLPMKLRIELELQRAFLRRTPTLARIPNTKDGIAPAYAGRRERVARRVVRVRRGLRRRLDRPLRRAGFPPRSGYSDYASHLRSPVGTSLLGVLLDDRTLDRGQIRREGVRELIDETLAGSGRHTQALGTLLTLELFQRQFIDGDGLDGPSLDGASLE